MACNLSYLFIQKKDEITTEFKKVNSKIDAVEQLLKKPFKVWSDEERTSLGIMSRIMSSSEEKRSSSEKKKSSSEEKRSSYGY